MKKIPSQSLLRTAMVGGFVALTASLQAADVVKADNTNDLNSTLSWFAGSVPSATDVAVWDSTVTGANTTVLGGNIAFGGIRIANPGGLVTIGAGSTLTNGASGIDMTAATQDLTINSGVFIAPSAIQKWNVAPGRTLTLAGVPTKPGQPSNNTGALEVGTGGTVVFGAGTVPLILDNQNNPWVTYGPNDWAALSGGTVIAATYTDATTALTAGANNNVIGDFNINATVDVASMRFNDPTPRNLQVSSSGTARTLTARGILVTENSGGGSIAGNTASSFIRMNRVTIANSSFNVIQNSLSDFTIGANISNGSSSAPTHLVKQGRGNLILTHPANGYSGGTDINAGTVTVASGGSIGSGGVTVNGGTFVGSSGATIAPSVTYRGGTTNKVLVLAANGQFTQGAANFSGTTAALSIISSAGVAPSTTVAPLKINGTMTVAGTLSLSVLNGSITIGTFPLIQATNGFAGAGSIVLATLPPRVNATLNTNGNIIELVVSSVNQPVKWTKGSETWNFSSINWQDAAATPTAYQEIAGFGDSVVFEDTLSGGSPITVTLNTNVQPSSVTVTNSSKQYTISGSGSIAGVGGLTKSGSGSLTLTTANTFAGGIALNGGTTIFSSINNLGTGNISFGGGTLQYNGNSDDISVRTVTFAAGGATINVGASTVSFANPVGNSGAGGLTKSGAGSLTLSGANNYSGNTTVSQGSLVLASGATVANSPVITVSSGATLDVTASGLVLNGAANQVLAGAGTVSGAVTSGTGTSLTPGTSPGTLTINGDVTMVGGTYVFDVSTNSGKDLIVVNGNLALTNGTVQVVASGNLTNGLYRLFNYTGTLSGAAANLLVSGFAQAGKIATLDDSIPNQINLKVQTLGGASIVWAGLGANWDVETSFNWNSGAAQFVNGDLVTFNDSGSAVPGVNLVGSLAPSSVTVNSTADYTFSTSGGGLISGSAKLAKSGAGKLTILTANNNSGSTTISAGTLQVGNGVTTGDIGSGPVTNNAELVFQQTDARSVSSIAGTGNLTQSGSSTLTVSGASTYTGTTTVGSGATLGFGNGGVDGVLSTSSITNDGLVILNSSSSWTLGVPVTGAGGLTKLGSGTLTLGGTKAYTGRTSADGGLLKFASNQQIQGELRIQSGGAVDLAGFNQTVPLFTSSVNAGGVLTNSASSGTNTVTVDVASGSSDNSVAIGDGTAGSVVRIVKTGAGELLLRGASTFSGGVVVSNGTINVSGGTSLGTGSLTLHNGSTLNDRTSFFSNPVHTTAGSTVTILSSATGNSLGGALTSGDANSTNLINNPISFSANSVKQFQGFTGTVQVGVAGMVRFSSSTLGTNGGDNTTFALEGPVQTRNGNVGGTGSGIHLGAVMDVPGSFFPGSLKGGDSSPFGLTTYVVGAKGLSTAFSGSIEGTAPGSTAIVKTGAGSWTLSGLLSYDGNTTVSGGSLILSGSAELDDSPSITVSGGTLNVTGIGGLNLGQVKNQTLGGAGSVTGNVTATGVNAATFTPGSPIGTLAISGALTMAANTTNIMELNRTNAPATNDMITASSISAAGALVVTNVGTPLQAGDTFKLFSTGVSGFSSITLPATFVQNGSTNNYVWNTSNLAVNGTISVVTGFVAVNTTPTNIVSSYSNGVMTLSWPASHTGWSLQMQTNAANVGLNTNWVTVAGSASTNSVSITNNNASATAFFRLVYP